MCCPSATFAVWCSAWLNGRAAADDVLDALSSWGLLHEVAAADEAAAEALALPDAGAPPAAAAHLLGGLRKLGATRAHLVLAAAGDARGLGGGGPFTTGALDAGEGVLLPEIGIGIVPTAPADQVMRWTVHRTAHTDPGVGLGLGDAEHALLEQMRSSTGTLAALDVARARPDAHQVLRAKLKATPRLDWPAGMPGRALRVLQRAEEVSAIVALADDDDPGAAVSASAATRRSEALRPLASSVREARRAAIDEAVRVLTAEPERTP